MSHLSRAARLTIISAYRTLTTSRTFPVRPASVLSLDISARSQTCHGNASSEQNPPAFIPIPTARPSITLESTPTKQANLIDSGTKPHSPLRPNPSRPNHTAAASNQKALISKKANATKHGKGLPLLSIPFIPGFDSTHSRWQFHLFPVPFHWMPLYTPLTAFPYYRLQSPPLP